MRLTSARRPRSRLSLIPLIDVMLVLLFFFMLATSYVEVERTRLELASGGRPSGGGEAATVAVVLEQGLMRYGGEVRPLAELLPQLRALPADAELRLAPAPGLSLQTLLAVWERLRDEGVAAKLEAGGP